ncbi:MAG: hypothetical protein EP344_03845 [Bacteroidetes bacterium]|nr:MAG: hypothetical protein EP344_03845 [Bacteroidota bacterium]
MSITGIIILFHLIRLVLFLIDHLNSDTSDAPAAANQADPRWNSLARTMDVFYPRFPFLEGQKGRRFLEAVLRPLIGNQDMLNTLDYLANNQSFVGRWLEAVWYWLPREGRQPVENWPATCPQFQGREYHKYLVALTRYLFQQHSVPQVVEALWWNYPHDTLPLRRGYQSGDQPAEVLQLYFYLTKGGSLRKAPMLDWELSRGAVQAFYQAPAHLGFRGAYWYALFRTEGVNREILDSLHYFPNGYRHTTFWRDLARLWDPPPSFSENADLLGAVICQIDWLKFGAPSEALLQHSRLADKYGTQPDFSLKGRTVGSLIRYLEEELGIPEFAPPQGLQEFYYLPGPDNQPCLIRFIGSGPALMLEGALMAHCVGGEEYIDDARSGVSSFWSLREITPGGQQKRLLTVQLINGALVEAKGLANREASPEEWTLLEGWLAGLFPAVAREQAIAD